MADLGREDVWRNQNSPSGDFVVPRFTSVDMTMMVVDLQ